MKLDFLVSKVQKDDQNSSTVKSVKNEELF